MESKVLAMPDGPRSRPTGRAALRLAGIAASIAIAGCSGPTVFVWTASDVFGLGILGLVIAFYLVVMVVLGLKAVWRRIKRAFQRTGGARG